jgi:hypothetical protein
MITYRTSPLLMLMQTPDDTVATKQTVASQVNCLLAAARCWLQHADSSGPLLLPRRCLCSL